MHTDTTNRCLGHDREPHDESPYGAYAVRDGFCDDCLLARLASLDPSELAADDIGSLYDLIDWPVFGRDWLAGRVLWRWLCWCTANIHHIDDDQALALAWLNLHPLKDAPWVDETARTILGEYHSETRRRVA